MNSVFLTDEFYQNPMALSEFVLFTSAAGPAPVPGFVFCAYFFSSYFFTLTRCPTNKQARVPSSRQSLPVSAVIHCSTAAFLSNGPNGLVRIIIQLMYSSQYLAHASRVSILSIEVDASLRPTTVFSIN